MESSDLTVTMTRRLLDDPGLIDAVAAELTSGGHDMAACLRARWMLHEALGLNPTEIVRDSAFLVAARALDGIGDPGAAQAIRALADTGSELNKGSREWGSRYTGRPQTAHERADAQLLAAGWVTRQAPPQAEMGADGARYEAATLAPRAGRASGEIAIVTTSAQTTEIVAPFTGAAQRDAWIDDRLRGREGPLASWSAGPSCRTTREEQVLAWALRHSEGSVAAGDGWRPRSFTTHTRSEIFAAWVTVSRNSSGRPSMGEVEDELERRLLRAPGWAAPETGWPPGQAAISYLRRLAATDVSLPEAMRAAGWLIREDRAALRASQSPARPNGRRHQEAPARQIQQRRAAPLEQPGPALTEQALTPARHQRI